MTVHVHHTCSMVRTSDIVLAGINHLAHHLRPPEQIQTALFSSDCSGASIGSMHDMAHT